VKQFIYQADQNWLLPVRHTDDSIPPSQQCWWYTTTRAIDDGHVAALALLDLSSAFDSVDHFTVMSILRSRFSVTEQPLEWFRSYLTGRTQAKLMQYRSCRVCHKARVLVRHVSYTECTRYLFLTLRSVPHVCRRLTVLQSLCKLRFLH